MNQAQRITAVCNLIIVALLLILVCLLVWNAKIWMSEGMKCVTKIERYYQDKINDANPGAVCRIVAQCQRIGETEGMLLKDYTLDVNLSITHADLKISPPNKSKV